MECYQQLKLLFLPQISLIDNKISIKNILFRRRVGIRNISDYSPFGVLLKERTVEGAKFRRGFQGQEHDDEVKGEGNSYSTYFRQLDTRIGRWLTIDPKYNSMESPYVSMGNSPIQYNDPLGDTLQVTKNEQSTNDIASIVKDENQGRVIFGSDGRVNLNFEGLNEAQKDRLLSDDEGLKLLNDLISSDKVIQYSALENYRVRRRDNNNGNGRYTTVTMNVMRDETGISNISRGGLDALGNNYYLPVEDEIDGLVIIHPSVQIFEARKPDGKFVIFKKSRASVVFHELAENFERTHNGIDYTMHYLDDADNYCTVNQDEFQSSTDTGAHVLAIQREQNWHGKSRSPGQGSVFRTIGRITIGGTEREK